MDPNMPPDLISFLLSDKGISLERPGDANLLGFSADRIYAATSGLFGLMSIADS
jgi:hypothetical protein